ncbi:MAG: outer membrane protein assembly factor BamB family protein [Gaiellales bacterium]
MGDRSAGARRRLQGAAALIAIGTAAAWLFASAAVASAAPAGVVPCTAPLMKTWPTYGGNYQRTRNDCAASPVQPPFVKRWAVNEHGLIEFPPIYAAGRLFLGMDDGWLLAINPATGATVWKERFAQIRQSPTYYSGHLVFETSPQGVNSTRPKGLFSVSANSGKIIWHQSLMGEGSPTVVPGIPDPQVCAADSRTAVVACYDAWNGARRWVRQLPLRPTSSQINAAMAYSQGYLFVADYYGDVYKLATSNGVPAWGHTYSQLSVYGSVAYADKLIFLASRAGSVWALRASNGTKLWKTTVAPSAYGSPAIAGDSVYTSTWGSTYGTYYKLNEYTGAVQWRHTSTHHSMASPVVVGNIVYFSNVGPSRASSGQIVGYNRSDMSLAFVFPDGKYSPCIVAGNSLIISGFSRLYRLDPKG